MDLKRLFDQGKKIVDQRGGVESLKADASELSRIAKGKGSLSDKAKEAAAAIKDPGGPGGEKRAAKPGGAGQPAGAPAGNPDPGHAGKPHAEEPAKPHVEEPGKPHAEEPGKPDAEGPGKPRP